MTPYIIGGLLGFSIGVAIQRIIIDLSVKSVPQTICDHCHWKKENQWRWEKMKDRHKM